jgi:hypothetical protein
MDLTTIGQAFVRCCADASRRYAPSEMIAAEREFRRSRRRAIRRIIGRALGGDAAATASLRPCGAEDAWIDLRAIDGYEDAAGEAALGLPPLPRELFNAWCGAYLRMADDGEERVFRFRPHRGGWFLVGGGEALVGLEIARMRGERGVRAKLEAPMALCPGAAVDRDGRAEGDLGAA